MEENEIEQLKKQTSRAILKLATAASRRNVHPADKTARLAAEALVDMAELGCDFVENLSIQDDERGDRVKDIAKSRLYWPLSVCRYTALHHSPDRTKEIIEKELGLSDQVGLKLDRRPSFNLWKPRTKAAYDLWHEIELVRNGRPPFHAKRQDWWDKAKELPPLCKSNRVEWWEVAAELLNETYGDDWEEAKCFEFVRESAEKRADRLSSGFTPSFLKSQVMTEIKSGWEALL